ncbi:glucose 1-dehydrogenase [Bacillus lacus]|uniref:Glucose 1-dehydrogenase n=1 Tax=Metabacillus lacus TaxID=1983721 RepID=A0A7X2LWK5_9BACI|nr:glucose 1-dehydrogenase [Metabacillus lacus]MRX71585.1 glucose 1-dehydrogenase [Metabacillus lacus]
MHLLKLFDLTGKTAIVTGGGRGLGEQMCLSLAEAGANVVVCSRKIEACRAVADKVEAKGVKALALQCDITKKEEIENVISTTIDKFGTLDILVNNSGVSWAGSSLKMPEEAWQKVFDVNVKGMFLFSQAAAAVMISKGSGKIINIASIAGYGGTMILDTVAYNSSKGAVMTLTKDMAVKLAAYNIQVNAIAPGFFDTKISKPILDHYGDKLLHSIPARRIGSECDLKGAAVYLASHASDYVTGHILNVDGGISALA